MLWRKLHDIKATKVGARKTAKLACSHHNKMTLEEAARIGVVKIG